MKQHLGHAKYNSEVYRTENDAQRVELDEIWDVLQEDEPERGQRSKTRFLWELMGKGVLHAILVVAPAW